jgi:D-lactate dehydrogenase (cytochrome)
VIQARRADSTATPSVVADPAIIEAYVEDASGAGPGRAAGLARPADEAAAAALLRDSGEPVLFQAARSSLTGGAVPRGEILVSVERMAAIGPVESHPGGSRVRVGPGVRLAALQEALAGAGHYYPPVPTYQEAMIGGTVSTNAGGAASFKYGVTRNWVRGLRVVLANGDLLEFERGQALAPRGEAFDLRLADGSRIDLRAPSYRLPDLKKISAGYFAADSLDLVDLFVGSEGTLGLITEITLDLVPLPPAVLTGLAFTPTARAMLDVAGELRRAAGEARDHKDPAGPDVRSIESLDAACLDLLRAHGDTRRLRVRVPESARGALLFEIELPRPVIDGDVQDEVAAFVERRPDLPDTPVARLCTILERFGLLDDLELAFPGDPVRRAELVALREAAPTRVAELLARRRREEPALHKVGGDLIVPFDELPAMVATYEEGFARRGLDYAVWGHLSDGNLHPNALPRDRRQLALGREALLGFADEATRRGGCPLSEHGVGRDPLKQEILRRFLGTAAIDEMRRVKSALDPRRRLAPGVLFPRDP